MTKPMAIPSALTIKRRDTTPKANFVKAHSSNGRGIAVARKARNTSQIASAAQISPDKPLTEKQRLFVQAWAEGNSLTVSAKRAGYTTDKLSYRLARMPNILALKHEYEKKYERAAQMSRAKVLEGFKDSIAMATLMSEPMTMIAGWREIGRLCGYYAPVETRVKMDVTGEVTMNRLSTLSDAELLEMIERKPDEQGLDQGSGEAPGSTTLLSRHQARAHDSCEDVE